MTGSYRTGRNPRAQLAGRYLPFRVLSLETSDGKVASLRFLAPADQTLRRWTGFRESQNFHVGEAVLGAAAPEAREILPELMFAFDLLQVENTVQRGGGG